jgi:hypothetical protein
MPNRSCIWRELVAIRRSFRYIAGGISVLLCPWCATAAMSLGLSQLCSARALVAHDFSLATSAGL